MKDFEKALRDLPKPEVPVAEFKRSLRAELDRTIRQRAGGGYRRPFLLATAATAVLALMLGVFIVKPQIPQRLHAALAGESAMGEPATLSGSAAGDPLANSLEAVLRQSSATAAVDRDMIGELYRRHALPAEVGQMSDEQIFAVRQFELTNGERVVIFTELGSESTSPSMSF